MTRWIRANHIAQRSWNRRPCRPGGSMADGLSQRHRAHRNNSRRDHYRDADAMTHGVGPVQFIRPVRPRCNIYPADCQNCSTSAPTPLAQSPEAKKVPFDPKVFLATANGGRSLSRRTKSSSPGRAIVAVLGPDEFCGEGCLTGQPRRMATATAMTECEIMRLDKAAIIRVLHEEPAFSEMFVSLSSILA
jgi:Cyclic nucleotide-binding domain